MLPSSIADPWDRAVGDYLNPVLSGVKPVSRITTNLRIRLCRFVNLSLTIPALFPFSTVRETGPFLRILIPPFDASFCKLSRPPGRLFFSFGRFKVAQVV